MGAPGLHVPLPAHQTGNQPFRMATATANAAKTVEYALFDGYDHVVQMQIGTEDRGRRGSSTDFEQLFEAWVSQMEWLFNLLVRTSNFGRYMDPELFGRPFLSAICERSVEYGLDIVSPGERGNAWVTVFTWVETRTAWQR